MKAKLIKVGNSRGIRLPKAIIEQAGLGDEVELDVRGDQVVIRAKTDPREGWEEACRRMHECGDDELLDGPLPSLTKFDAEEWEW
ncbi:MAG TPA: AbrB/MazE/SpoVT family DNA-binding domain-containing protein [Pirellulaceae bacterium]|nr:AbrB/MazE/SpoVT family DNA-binding domain-containing protein [Pirellulaceae bacterium]